jgi:hypothetical protein
MSDGHYVMLGSPCRAFGLDYQSLRPEGEVHLNDATGQKEARQVPDTNQRQVEQFALGNRGTQELAVGVLGLGAEELQKCGGDSESPKVASSWAW